MILVSIHWASPQPTHQSIFEKKQLLLLMPSIQQAMAVEIQGVTGFPFVIIGEVTGESVNGNTTWYKIQTDGSLNADRTNLDIKRTYDFTHDYGYVNASLINVIQKGNNSTTDNTPAPSPSPEPIPSYKMGDVNGDGKITPADYVKVKNHIMGKSKLTGDSLKAADMNKDGKITPADYVKIKNTINGEIIVRS